MDSKGCHESMCLRGLNGFKGVHGPREARVEGHTWAQRVSDRQTLPDSVFEGSRPQRPESGSVCVSLVVCLSVCLPVSVTVFTPSLYCVS